MSYVLQDVTELLCRLHAHLKVSVDQDTVNGWLSEKTGNSADWVDFWSFLTVTMDKCLESKGTDAVKRALKSVYDEIFREVHSYHYLFIQ